MRRRRRRSCVIWLGWHKTGFWLARVRWMVNVDCPLIAVLRDNACHHLFERVPALAASQKQKHAAACNHGRGVNGQENIDGAPLHVFSSLLRLQTSFTVNTPPSASHSVLDVLRHTSCVCPGYVHAFAGRVKVSGPQHLPNSGKHRFGLQVVPTPKKRKLRPGRHSCRVVRVQVRNTSLQQAPTQQQDI